MATIKIKFDSSGHHGVTYPLDYSFLRDPYKEIIERYREAAQISQGIWFEFQKAGIADRFVMIGNDENFLRKMLLEKDCRFSDVQHFNF